MSAPPKAVFLSYASQDAGAARRICDALRAAGVDVWFDQSALRGGDAWDASIRRKIKECALFVPIVSATTQAREEGYFRLEWKLAVDRSHLMAADKAFLLPVAIDDVAESGARVPEEFRARQWSRLPGGETSADFCEDVKRLLGTPAAAPGPRTPVATAPTAPTTTRRQFRLLSALVGTAVVAIIAVVLAWQPWKTAVTTPVPVAVTAATSPAAASGSASVAVLPFANLSAEKADAYFADGISEELLNVLARIPGLRVSARTASFQFKGKDTPARDIGRQLGVDYIVEGGVRKAGNQVRITAQLVKVADGFQVWSETFTRDLKDIFAVQDEIAVRVARALQLRLGAGAGEKLATGATRNPAAYEAYLRSREAFNGEESGAREALRLLQQAVSLDPDFALAHGKLAETYVGLANGGVEPRDKAYPLARAAAERALALDERTVQAHNAMAEYAFHYAWDWDESDRHMRLALALDPNYYNALSHLASHESARGRLDSALDATRKAEERNPLSDTTGTQLVLILMKRYDEAIRLARKELAEHPGSKDTLDYLGIALFQAGQRDEGLRILEERTAANAESPRSQAMLGWAYGRAGQTTKARAVLQRLATIGKTRPVSPLLLAWVHSGLNDRDRAFAELEKAYEQRNPQMPFFAMFWTLDSIRDDPRYRSLLKRMKLDAYFPESPTR